MEERRYFPDRIVDWAPYGQHVGIYCKKCGATGSTKNIAPIGCRTLFIGCSCDDGYEPIKPENWEEMLQVELKKQERKDFINNYVSERFSMVKRFRELKRKGVRNAIKIIKRERNQLYQEAAELYDRLTERR